MLAPVLLWPRAAATSHAWLILPSVNVLLCHNDARMHVDLFFLVIAKEKDEKRA